MTTAKIQEPQSEKDATLFQLFLLIKSREEIINGIKRKRSMRDSEKIMAQADYKRQIIALQFAINHIKGIIKP